jgi:hypothetical protein
MHIELQVTASKLLALLRSLVKQQLPCITDTFSIPWDGKDVPVVVDHIDISDDTTFQRAHVTSIAVYDQTTQGDVIQLVQPFSVYLAALSDLAVADTQPLPTDGYRKVDLSLILNIAAKNEKDGWHLAVTYADLQALVPIPDAVKQKLQNAVQNFAPSPPFDLSSLKNLIGSVTIVQAGIGGDHDVSVLAFRLELSSSALEGVDAWHKFYTGKIDKRLPIKWTTQAPPVLQFNANGKPIKEGSYQPPPVTHVIEDDWSLFFDPALLVAATETRIANNADQGDFSLDTNQGVDVVWAPADYTAGLIATFSGSVTAPFGPDIGVDVTLGLTLYVDDQGNLVTATDVSYDASAWDEFVDALLDGIPLAIGGAVLGGGGGPIGAAIGAIAGFVVGFLGTLIYAAVYTPPLDQPNCTQVDDNTVICTQALPAISEPLIGKLEVNDLVGLADGPLLIGSLAAAAEIALPRISSVEIDGFGWGYHDPCGMPQVYADAEVIVNGKGNLPLDLCKWSVPAGSDKFNVLAKAVTVTSNFGNPSSLIQIDVSIPQATLTAYLNAPYPLQLLLQTNGGARLISIPPIAQPPEAELAASLLAAEVECVKTSDGFWNGGYNVIWNVAPGPDTAQLVQAVAIGLGAGEEVQLQDATGSILAAAQPNSVGMARVDALVTSQRIPIAVKRASTPEIGQHAAQQSRRLIVGRTAFRRATTIHTRSPCRAVAAGIVDGARLLLCITAEGMHDVFDLANPSRPQWQRHFSLPGLRGAIRSGGQFVLWGAAGLYFVGRDLQCRPVPSAIARQLPKGAIQTVSAGASAQLRVQMEDGTVVLLDPIPVEGSAPKIARLPPTLKLPNDPWFENATSVGRIVARIGKVGAVEIWQADSPIVVG